MEIAIKYSHCLFFYTPFSYGGKVVFSNLEIITYETENMCF